MDPTAVSPDGQGLAEKISEFLARVQAVKETRPPRSGILHLSGLHPGGILAADGEDTQIVLSKREWEQSYFELFNGKTADMKMKTLDELERMALLFSKQQLVPIFVGYYIYHSAAELFTSFAATEAIQGQPAVLPSPEEFHDFLQEKRAFFAAAYLPDVFRDFERLPEFCPGLEVDFILPSGGYLSNASSPLKTIEIDFGDGLGARRIIFDQAVHIAYEDAGTKTLQLRASGDTGTLQARFVIEVKETAVPSYIYWDNLSEDFRFNDKVERAVGHAFVFLAPGHTSLVNPFIVADGFPGHEIGYIWDALNEEDFATSLLTAGIDLIAVSYTAGKTYIEANAGVVIAAVKKALQGRTGNAKLVVGGASMGGQVARYALAYMERHAFPEVQEIGTSFLIRLATPRRQCSNVRSVHA